MAGSFTEDQAATAPSARRLRPIPSGWLMNCLKQPLRRFAKINGGAVTKHEIISSERQYISDAFGLCAFQMPLLAPKSFLNTLKMFERFCIIKKLKKSNQVAFI